MTETQSPYNSSARKPAPTYAVRLTVDQMRLIAAWAEMRQAQLDMPGLPSNHPLSLECAQIAAIIRDHLAVIQT